MNFAEQLFTHKRKNLVVIALQIANNTLLIIFAFAKNIILIIR